MKDKLMEKGIEMINKLGENYLYVREIEDEAFEDGARSGLVRGFVTGVILASIIFLAI